MRNFLRNPKFLRHFHAIMTVFFIVMIPVAEFTPLKESVNFLVLLSLWALVAAHWGAWQATRAEESNKD